MLINCTELPCGGVMPLTAPLCPHAPRISTSAVLATRQLAHLITTATASPLAPAAAKHPNALLPSPPVFPCLQVRLWDLRTPQCQGLLQAPGLPTVAFDEQGLVFCVGAESGVVKLYDARNYAQGPFTAFTVGAGRLGAGFLSCGERFLAKWAMSATALSFLHFLPSLPGGRRMQQPLPVLFLHSLLARWPTSATVRLCLL